MFFAIDRYLMMMSCCCVVDMCRIFVHLNAVRVHMSLYMMRDGFGIGIYNLVEDFLARHMVKNTRNKN